MPAIYVLPTREKMPPQAVIFEGAVEVELPEGEKGLAVTEGVIATWSSDMGTWTVAGVPVDNELAEAITDHAKSLGVEW